MVVEGGIVEGGKGAVGLFPRPFGERVRVRGGRGRGGVKIPLTPAQRGKLSRQSFNRTSRSWVFVSGLAIFESVALRYFSRHC
jgi:hypothetical protein